MASSFDQGLVNFRHILHFLKSTIESDPSRWRIQDSANRATITDRQTGAMLRVLGSDPRRLHGAAPKLILADEVANGLRRRSTGCWPPWRPAGARSRAAKCCGSAHGRRDRITPFETAFQQMEYSQVPAARNTAPPFQRRTWKRANPGLDRLPDLEAAIRQEAKRAKIDPSALARFRALRLNQGVSDTVENVLLDADVWREIETEQVEQGSTYVLGLALGQSAAMSAAAAYWIDTGGLDAFAVFPQEPTLHSRGLADGVDRLYVECAERGN